MKSSSPHDKTNLSPRKRRFFLLLTLSFPLLVFVCLEVLLRFLSYGPNLDLFVTEQQGERILYVMNPDVKLRYFHRTEFSPNTSIDYFQVPKPQGTFRIFCLGGSTTVGFPYGPAGSFSAFLKDRLQLLYPTRSIEVINLGMTATNSFTVNDIVKELLRFEPDLLIVYDGHNEFYGALGVASHETIAGQRWTARLFLKLVHLKTFLFLRDLLSSLFSVFPSSQDSDSPGSLMEQLAQDRHIPHGSADFYNALKAFEANLLELRDVAEQYRVPVIAGTQVSNLRDQEPFVSAFSDHVSEQDRGQFQNLLERTRNDGDWKSQIVHDLLMQAGQIDSLRADVHFALGRHFRARGEKRQALLHYKKARDYDQLRFRASTEFNDAILRMHDGKTFFVADIETSFLQYSPDSLLGSNLILEHLHPNLYGYFLIAKAYSELISSQDILGNPTFPKMEHLIDDSVFALRTITALDTLAARRRTEILTSHWPFVSDPTRLNNLPTRDPLTMIVNKLLLGELTWEQAHVEAAELYERQRNYPAAEKEYRTLITHFPHNISPFLRLGQLYINSGRLREAEAAFQQSLSIQRSPFALVRIGGIQLEAGRIDAALPLLEEAYSISSDRRDRIESGYYLALAYSMSNQSERSIAVLQKVLQIDPSHSPTQLLFRQLSRTQ